MDKNIKTLIIIVVIIAAFILITRSCQRVKQVKIKETSTEQGGQLAVEVKKEKE